MSLVEKARNYLKKQNDVQISFLHLIRSESKVVEMPQTETPYIYFVLDGKFRLYTPYGELDYMEGQYSVSAIDTPERGYVLAYSKQQDFLAAAVDFTANDVMSVIIKLDDHLLHQILEEPLEEAWKFRQDALVCSSLERLFDAMEDPCSLDFLSRQIRTEMIFHVLCGSCGKSFIQSITKMKEIKEIYEANSWIKKNYRESFKVEELAEQWNMSVSQFHLKFKNAVGMGPLQCQKRLRLTEARRLMLDAGKTVTEAALEVGYESASQFTREYRKMFGSAPKEDIRLLQRSR